MELVNAWTLAKSAAQRWWDFYHDPSVGIGWYDKGAFPDDPHRSPFDVYQELLRLGRNPSPDDVKEVIGNSSWTFVGECHECNARKDELVKVGNGHMFASALLCVDCALKAFRLLDEG